MLYKQSTATMICLAKYTRRGFSVSKTAHHRAHRSILPSQVHALCPLLGRIKERSQHTSSISSYHSLSVVQAYTTPQYWIVHQYIAYTGSHFHRSLIQIIATKQQYPTSYLCLHRRHNHMHAPTKYYIAGLGLNWKLYGKIKWDK